MTLSGGELQRVRLATQIGASLAGVLYILDEPTTGLDPQARHLIWQKLRGLKREGRTMVLTTHNMEEASQLSDRLVIMDEGRILDEGSPNELVERHVKGSIVELMIPEAGPAGVLELLKGIRFEYELSGDTIFIRSDERDALIQRVSSLAGSGFVHRQATLEDVFLKLTGRELRE